MDEETVRSNYFGSALKKYREDNNVIIKASFKRRSLYENVETGISLCWVTSILDMLKDYHITENIDGYIKLYIHDFVSNIEDYCNLSKLIDVIRILMLKTCYDFRKEFKVVASDDSFKDVKNKPLINRIQLYFGLSLEEIKTYNDSYKSTDDIINDAQKAIDYYNKFGSFSMNKYDTVMEKHRMLFADALRRCSEDNGYTRREMQRKIDRVNIDFTNVEKGLILPMILNVSDYLAAYGFTYDRTWKYRYILSYIGRCNAMYERNIHYLLISIRLSLRMTDKQFYKFMHINGSTTRNHVPYSVCLRLKSLFNIDDNRLIEGKDDCLGRIIDTAINGVEYFEKEGHKMVGVCVGNIYI